MRLALEDHLSRKKEQQPARQPHFFDLQKKAERDLLNQFFRQGRIVTVRDEYILQEQEYHAINHPDLSGQQLQKHFVDHVARLTKEAPLWQHGRWVYYPWNSALVHILNEKPFFRVRTARNRDLITEEEQVNFYNSRIGIIGLSVGHSIALALALQGGGGSMKLVDYDSLALSNLNRIRTGVENIGLKKTEIAERDIYAINPYARIETFSGGLNQENLRDFFQKLGVAFGILN